MLLRTCVIVCVLFCSFVHGCHTPPRDRDLRARDSADDKMPTVDVGSVTEGGQLELSYNQIKRGMTIEEVQSILGRRYDEHWRPGGSMGNDWYWWYEDGADIFVDFEWGTGKACNKTITRSAEPLSSGPPRDTP